MNDLDTKQFATHVLMLFEFIQDYLYALKDEPALSVSQLYDRFCSQKAFKNFALSNQDTEILFVWGLIALPKETFFEVIPSIDFRSLPNNWGDWEIQKWDLLKKEVSRDLKSFVRHIRNSINHGRFSSDTNLIYTFEDIDMRTKGWPINFSVRAHLDSLIRFAKSLGKGYVMNEWPKSK